jgi:hypothetical protein
VAGKEKIATYALKPRTNRAGRSPGKHHSGIEISEGAYSQLDNSFFKKELKLAHIHGRHWILNQIS